MPWEQLQTALVAVGARTSAVLTKLQEIDLQSHWQLTESPPAAVHALQWLIEICFTEVTFSLKVNEHCLWAPMLSVPVLEIWKTPLVTFVTLQARASGAVALVVAETREGALAVAETAETDAERPRRAAQRIFMADELELTTLGRRLLV